MPAFRRSIAAAAAVVSLACAAPAHAQLPDPRVLHVIRHAPSDSAASSGIVLIAFDRPVAGMLDRTVDPAKIFRITPVIRGALSWRDPATIRFVPESPLVPGDSFTVTIDTAFRAIDGARLDAPYRFRFRVPGPRLLTAIPHSEGGYGGAIGPDATFELAFSAALDSASLGRLKAGARLEFGEPCAVHLVPLRVISQKPIERSASWPIQQARAVPNDTVGDGFRRVVEMAPASLLPDGCRGYWYVPSVDPSAPRDVWRYGVTTRPVFAVVKPPCGYYCSPGRIDLTFTAPVRRSDVERYVTISPRIDYRLAATYTDAQSFTFDGAFTPGTTYFVHLSPELRDKFGRALTGDTLVRYDVSNRMAAVTYQGGLKTIPRGSDLLRARISNADTLRIVVKPVPESQRPRAIRSVYFDPDWYRALPESSVYFVAPNLPFNVEADTLIRIPRGSASDETILAVDVSVSKASRRPIAGPRSAVDTVVRRAGANRAVALLQASDVVVHAKAGDDRSAVFVTSTRDGRPVAGARVAIHDTTGALVAEGRTDHDGLAMLHFRSIDWMMKQFDRRGWSPFAQFGAYAEVASQGGRAATPLGTWSSYEVQRAASGGAWHTLGGPAAAIFTDRGIYRPGETLYIETIIRVGSLGDLRPLDRDSARITLEHYGPEGLDTAYRAVLRTSDLGTAIDSIPLRALTPLGSYLARVSVVRGGGWTPVSQTSFAVAEYRAPEFTASAHADSLIQRAGDTLNVDLAARYYFGAPMAGGVVTWSMNVYQLAPWELRIPHTEGFVVGGSSYDDWLARPHVISKYAVDTLGAAGTKHWSILPPADSVGGDARVMFSFGVADVNRQTVTSATSSIVRTRSFYLATRDMKRTWFWRPGAPDSIGVIAVRGNGDRLRGVRVEAQLLRRRWTGGTRAPQWTIDTVAASSLETDTSAVLLRLTPPTPGDYQVRLVARDERGRLVTASLAEYAFGGTFAVGSPLALSIAGPKDTLRAGDVAMLAYTSPFESAEAWITIEREHVIEQRRETVGAGAHELRVAVRDAFAPDVFVSVALVNRSSAPAADSVASLLRVGYARLDVSTQSRRLTVSITPARRTLAPAEQAGITVRLLDHGRAAKGEVTLWAVDEGVLALTGYDAPDPLAMIYAPRGVGSIFGSGLFDAIAPKPPPPMEAIRIRGLASGAAMTALSEVVAEAPVALESAAISGLSAKRKSGAASAGASLRETFRSTAFFLGQRTTDDDGYARLHVKLPDNLTTFRLVAVGVASDRYGAAEDSLLVTRPLVARPSLPRFVRPGDSVFAGVALSARSGAPSAGRVTIAPENVTLRDSATRTLPLGVASTEVRWHFAVPATDTSGSRIGFRFDASSNAGADAVKVSLPVQPAYVPRSHTIAGVVRGSSRLSFELPPDIDPARSRLSLDVATSPLGVLHWAYRYLEAYPYYCTEQLMSTGRAMVAVYRARQSFAPDSADARFLGSDPVQSITSIATEIAKRQSATGGIKYWRDDPWTDDWLSANAGLFLLDARDAGASVDESTLDRLAKYLQTRLKESVLGDTMSGTRADRRVYIQGRLGRRLAIAQFLRRDGSPAIAAEQQLVALADRMSWEDRVWLAELLTTSDHATAKSLLDAAWSSVTVAGRRIDLPDSTVGHGPFESHIRPPARLLLATLAVDPGDARLGALMETILQLGRAERSWAWNTQDYSSAIVAAAGLSRGQTDARGKGLVIRQSDDAQRPPLMIAGSNGVVESIPLTGLTRNATDRSVSVPLTIAGGSVDSPLYYSLTITEVPKGKSTIADQQGMFVERWYERYDDGSPVTSVNEGDLVRVRLRVTVPSDREFVALDDALPAGLEAADLSLRTSATLGPFETMHQSDVNSRTAPGSGGWSYGSWQQGWWSPWEHRELRDDRVLYFARMLWAGTYSASYVARATTAGTFVLPPARAEEMYNPALQGRSAGGTFSVRPR